MTLINPVNIYIPTEIHRFLFMREKSVSLKTEINKIRWLLRFRRILVKAV